MVVETVAAVSMSCFPGTNVAAKEIDGRALDDAQAFVSYVARSKTKFPGPNPVSISRSNFLDLKKDAYWISAKTDGVRAALVCFKSEGRNYVVFFDRSRRAFALRGNPFHLCKAWYEGTLLDGEIVGDQFRIFDAAFVSGSNVGSMKFSERRAAMRAGLDMHFAAQNGRPPLFLVEKEFLFPSEFDVDTARQPGADGIIIMPENSPYAIGRHMRLFKVKTEHTVDFYFGRGGSLFVQERGKLFPVATLDETSKFLPDHGTIVECEPIGRDPIRWVAKLVREDKNYPNDMLTFENTVRDIHENISYDEIVALMRDLETRVYAKPSSGFF